jgi:hypothetical protein
MAKLMVRKKWWRRKEEIKNEDLKTCSISTSAGKGQTVPHEKVQLFVDMDSLVNGMDISFSNFTHKKMFLSFIQWYQTCWISLHQSPF